MKETLCIVVPIYSKKPSNIDIASMRQLDKACPLGMQICLIIPDDFDVDIVNRWLKLFNKDRKVLLETFDSKCFKSTVTYSALLKDQNFYNRFGAFKYILICQTDCWIFNLDAIYDWTDADFDYVGPPVITNKTHWPSSPCCGNGGLSLRKVDKFIEMTADKELREKLNKDKIYHDYEDVYFCEGMSQYVYIDMPSWEEAAEFGYDMNPDILYDRIKELPKIGCHAWPKNIPFWENHIDIPDNAIKEAYEKNKAFIYYYYHIGELS